MMVKSPQNSFVTDVGIETMMHLSFGVRMPEVESAQVYEFSLSQQSEFLPFFDPPLNPIMIALL
jgi:hypothetical protein